jgi:hypothetical protein
MSTLPLLPNEAGTNKKWLYVAAGVASLLIIIGLIVFFMLRKNPDAGASPTKTPEKVDHVKLLLSAISPLKENYATDPIKGAAADVSFKGAAADVSFKGDPFKGATADSDPFKGTTATDVSTKGATASLSGYTDVTITNTTAAIKDGMTALNKMYNDITGKQINFSNDTISTPEQFSQFLQKTYDTSMLAIIDMFNTVAVVNSKYSVNDVYRELGALFIALLCMLSVPQKKMTVKQYMDGDKVTRVDIVSSLGEFMIASKIQEIATYVGTLKETPAAPSVTLPPGITAFPSVTAAKYLATLTKYYHSAPNCSYSDDLCVARQMCNELSNKKGNDIYIEDIGKLFLLMFYTSRLK